MSYSGGGEPRILHIYDHKLPLTPMKPVPGYTTRWEAHRLTFCDLPFHEKDPAIEAVSIHDLHQDNSTTLHKQVKSMLCSNCRSVFEYLQEKKKFEPEFLSELKQL